MNGKHLYLAILLIVFALLQHSVESKKVVIHVPYRVKNVKHTHTIYKIIPHHKEHKHEHGGGDSYDFYRR